MRFSLDKSKQKDAKTAFNNIYKKLSSIDSEIAGEFIAWLDKKTTYFKDSVNKTGYNTQPDNIQRGDIVWVEFGINVGTELSDFNTKGHYALVWAVDLGNIVVIPLSSRDAIGSNLTFDIGVIPELNEDDSDTHSYLKLDAIRSISKRRIARMSGRENGKITLSDDNIKLVEQAIKIAFLNENY